MSILRTIFSADTSSYARGVAQAQNMTQRFTRNASRGFINLGRTIAGSLGLGLGGAAFARMASNAIRLADEIDKAAASTQVTREEIQRLQFAEERLTGSTGQLQGALQRLGRRIVSNEDQFREMGIEVRDSNGAYREIRDVLDDVANAIQTAESQAERLNIAQETMGQSGRQLVPMFVEGADGLRQMGEAAEEAGQIMDERTVKQLAEARDQLDMFGRRMTIVAAEVVEGWVWIGEAIAETTRHIRGTSEALSENDRAIKHQSEMYSHLIEMMNEAESAREIETAATIAAERASELYSRSIREAAKGNAELSDFLNIQGNNYRQLNRDITDNIDQLKTEATVRGFVADAMRQQEEAQKRLVAAMERARKIEQVTRAVRVVEQEEQEQLDFSRLSDELQKQSLQDRAEEMKKISEDEERSEERRIEAVKERFRILSQIDALEERIAAKRSREAQQEQREREQQANQRIQKLEREQRQEQSRAESLESEIAERRKRFEQGHNIRVSDIQRVGGGGGVVLPNEERVRKINEQQVKELEQANNRLNRIAQLIEQQGDTI